MRCEAKLCIFFFKTPLTQPSILYILCIYNIVRGDQLNINISNSSGEPIYEQIASQIKNAIMNNDLSEGDALPSMRLLAKELRISVITTKRAYEELENDGFIVSIVGKGSFVATKNLSFMREEHLRKVESLLSQSVDTAKMCGLELEELVDMLTIFYKGE